MSRDEDVPVSLTEQVKHQIRVVRSRSFILFPFLFSIGFGVSVLGLIPSVTWSIERGSPTVGACVFSLFAILFGSGTARWLLPIRSRPRIVPYFARALGDYGGSTQAAFPRGRGLYREIAALDRLASSLGVMPLTSFGFAYDHFGQVVQWHVPSEGLRTAEALRQGLDVCLLKAPGVAGDLEALASVMRMAVDQGVDFSLVLRLHEKDSMQAVCCWEERQGSFW